MYTFCLHWVLSQPAVLPPGNKEGTSLAEEILTCQPQPGIRYPDPSVEGSGSIQLITEGPGVQQADASDNPRLEAAGSKPLPLSLETHVAPGAEWGKEKEEGSGRKKGGKEERGLGGGEKEPDKGRKGKRRKEWKGSKNTLTQTPVNTRVHSSTNSQSPKCGSNQVSTNG